MQNTKQVIVVRKDLGMRAGKMCAQVAHASLSFLTKSGEIKHRFDCDSSEFLYSFENHATHMKTYQPEITAWLKFSYRKIVCYVNSEEELKHIHEQAKARGLISYLIEDNGATEFHGIKTLTCCAIGPHVDSTFINLTDHLPLL
jgi:PTH2 family peptidyl-tRNA hydrolase